MDFVLFRFVFNFYVMIIYLCERQRKGEKGGGGEGGRKGGKGEKEEGRGKVRRGSWEGENGEEERKKEIVEQILLGNMSMQKLL